MLFRVFTLLAVIALAVSTWILSSPSHRPKPVVNGGPGDLPGYYLKNALLTDYGVDGKPSIHLEAERIDQVDHGTEVTLSNVRVDYKAPHGQSWVMFSDFARVEPGGKVIDAHGNVRLMGEATAHAGMVIMRTDTLSYDVPEAVASTKSDARVEFGAHTLTARGLVANLKERTLHLESRVNGRFQR